MEHITTPGEVIGIEEEFIGAANTFLEKGVIYATTTGTIVREHQHVSIRSSCAKRPVREGDVFFGRVEMITDQYALVDIDTPPHVLKPPGYINIHISAITNGYVESIRSELRVGDIVRVKVIEIRKNGAMYATMKDASLGVIKAFCSKCRYPLPKTLVCEFCGSKEKRKLAHGEFYGRRH